MSPHLLYSILIGGGAFLLVLSLWIMGLILWLSHQERRASLVQRRLGLTPKDPQSGRTLRLWLDGREVETAVERDARLGVAAGFAARCREAGWEAPPQTIFLAVAGVVCAAFALVLTFVGNVIVAVGIAGLIATLFWFYLQQRIRRRRALFDNQLIDALELAARSLHVGHPLVSALRLVSEEVGAPIGPMFASIVQQQELGISLSEAIRNTALASSSEDLKLFATAVIIQLRSGGNLADMMERVASVMRDRLRLSRRVRVLITQTQFSKQVLLSLPVFMFVLLNWMNPTYMRLLYVTTSGRMILAAAILLMVIGSIIMNRLSSFRY